MTFDFFKGQRIMKTATLTILRRLLAMALGALGLGAFAAGPASAQQIPAPDLFDGQVACSMNVPTPPTTLLGTDPVTMVDRALTAKIKAGTVIVDSDNDGTPDGTDAALASITYIIDPTNGNCGAGTYSQAEFDAASVGGATPSFAVGDPKPVAPGVAADVGAGYSDALAKFMAKVDADAAVATAQDALDAWLTDELDDIGQVAEITAAREARDLALAAQTRANDALTAAGAGPINMTGIAAWRAKAEVEAAVGEWNTAVRSLTTAGSDGQLGNLAYNEKYVQVDSDQLLALFDDDGNINLANVRQYANADGTNASTQDPTTGAITGDSAFDAAGNLILPMELWDDDGDSATPDVLRVNPEDTSTFSAVNTRLEAVNAELKLLKEFQEDNQNTLLDPVIDQAVWRAEQEQKHYQAQFDAMIADNTDLEPLNNDNDPENDTDSYSIMSRYGDYTAAKTTRDNAGVKLETAVQLREAATAAVRAAFTSPQDFYQQLVDRRSLLKDRADAEVARLAGLTGDDAPSEAMTEAADMAVTDAQTALEAAQATQESFQDLIADDSPVKDLVLETLKPDSGMGRGDDGGVLVDTIDNAFDAAAAAQAAAENAETASTTAGNAVAALTATDDPTTEDVDETGAVTKNANDIADINASLSGLTGDDGQVGQNTANIAQNMSDITDLDGRVTANEEEIGMDENGMSRIDHNETRSMNNATAIATNADNIATNASGIATNADNIATNASSISTNAGNIATNATAIADEEAARMAADTMLMGHITTNADSIVANAGNIMTNATNITTNATDIAANDVDIATNASDIMTNAGNIAMNNTYIMENRGMIGQNASDIMAVRGMASQNAADIATNAGNIAGNAMNINRNAESIQMLRAGVAASMALAGMPEIGDRGVSVGAGSYDGETALAVGIHFSGENSRFKLGITSADGETGASVGAGWSF